MAHVLCNLVLWAATIALLCTPAVHLRFCLTQAREILNRLGHASLGLALVIEANREVILADVVLLAYLC